MRRQAFRLVLFRLRTIIYFVRKVESENGITLPHIYFGKPELSFGDGLLLV